MQILWKNQGKKKPEPPRSSTRPKLIELYRIPMIFELWRKLELEPEFFFESSSFQARARSGSNPETWAMFYVWTTACHTQRSTRVQCRIALMLIISPPQNMGKFPLSLLNEIPYSFKRGDEPFRIFASSTKSSSFNDNICLQFPREVSK